MTKAILNISMLALLAAALPITGCGDLISLHGLYTPRDEIVDTAIEGKWENKDNRLTVARVADFYELTLEARDDPKETTRFEVRLVDIAGVRFADLLPMEMIGHMFLKVRVAEGQLRVAFFDSKWLLQRISYDEADQSNYRKQAVLTAQTPELRKMAARFAAEPKAYDEELTYRRSK